MTERSAGILPASSCDVEDTGKMPALPGDCP